MLFRSCKEPCFSSEFPGSFSMFSQSQGRALVPSRQSRGFRRAFLGTWAVPCCPPERQSLNRALSEPQQSPASLQRAQGVSLGFAESRAEPCHPPESSGVFARLCRCPAALQIFLAPSPAFGGAWAVSYCLPESSRAFTGLCLGPGSACWPSRAFGRRARSSRAVKFRLAPADGTIGSV